MIDPRIAKLPKWAQALIGGHDQVVERLQEELKEAKENNRFLHAKDKSNIIVEPGIRNEETLAYLPDWACIQFDFQKELRKGLRWINVRLCRPDHGEGLGLKVFGDSWISVEPESSNVVTVRARPR